MHLNVEKKTAYVFTAMQHINLNTQQIHSFFTTLAITYSKKQNKKKHTLEQEGVVCVYQTQYQISPERTI